jgi:protein-arginine kinase activator protein McsA
MEKGAYTAEEVQDIQEGRIDFKEDRIEKLKIELQEAVEKEDYEKAARIRDEIKKLESRH